METTVSGHETAIWSRTIQPEKGGVTISGVISGSGNLAISGSDGPTLSGNNTYSGSTSVGNDQNLTVGHANALERVRKLRGVLRRGILAVAKAARSEHPQRGL